MGLGLLLTEEVALVEHQGEVFLEEVWLKTVVVGEAGWVEVPLKTERVEGGLAVALQKTGLVGEELVVALLKTEMEATLEGAQRLEEKEASRVGAWQVVAQWQAGQGASLVVAMMEAILEGALLVEVEASESMEQKEEALTCSPCIGSSCSEMN